MTPADCAAIDAAIEKRLRLKGIPETREDTKKFYDAPLANVYSYLETDVDTHAVFSFKLKYFNSSSAKVLMDLFLAIEESASRGNQFKIEWHYASDDDNMQELGEEFAEELDKAEFEMVAF